MVQYRTHCPSSDEHTFIVSGNRNVTRIKQTIANMNADRLKVLKEFDSTRTGVKGLVDSGITSIPSFFHHPTSNLNPPTSSFIGDQLSIPTIDLSLPHSVAVDLIRSAARTTGFFHVINHGVPSDVVDRAISSVRCFNEMESEERKKYYSREMVGGVSYASNVDLFKADAASWRDTIQIDLGRVDPAKIPQICRDELMLFSQHVYELGKHVIGLLSEGLGVGYDKLEKMTVCDGRLMVCHYYPWCPEPEKTVGIASHTDPGAVTVLAQDQVGGLQVKMKGPTGEWGWVDVKPLDGAFVINVGDLLQIISNDEYKSVEHRVIANAHKEARVSLSTFFNPTKRGESDFFGPLPELTSLENPPIYRNFTMREFMVNFFSKGLASKCLVDHFKIKEV